MKTSRHGRYQNLSFVKGWHAFVGLERNGAGAPCCSPAIINCYAWSRYSMITHPTAALWDLRQTLSLKSLLIIHKYYSDIPQNCKVWNMLSQSTTNQASGPKSKSAPLTEDKFPLCIVDDGGGMFSVRLPPYSYIIQWQWWIIIINDR